TDARAVGSVVVRAVNVERLRAAEGGVDGPGNQVLLRPMVLAQAAVGMATGGVEVPQRHGPQPARAGQVVQRVLEDELRRTVRVDGVLRVVFVDRHPHGYAVDGARGAE